MPNYQLSKIYKLTSPSTTSVYIGSTTQPLYKRHFDHKEMYKRYLNNKTNYTTSFELIKHNDTAITLLERTPCNSKEELAARERHYIDTIPCVNKNKPNTIPTTGGIVEYQKEYQKGYRVLTKQSEHNQCACGGRYTNINKKAHMNTKKHVNFENAQKSI